MRFQRVSAPLVLGLSLGSFGWLPLKAEPAAADSTVIQQFCIAAFNSAFARAGKTPPQGMGAFTCDCLDQRIREGDDLGSARETCTMEASRRFPLPKG
jgi:hypothetical protein